jgi:hypothetical protein
LNLVFPIVAQMASTIAAIHHVLTLTLGNMSQTHHGAPQRVAQVVHTHLKLK